MIRLFLFRAFKLRLRRDAFIFSDDADLEVSGKIRPVETSHIYSGHLDGEYYTGCRMYKYNISFILFSKQMPYSDLRIMHMLTYLFIPSLKEFVYSAVTCFSVTLYSPSSIHGSTVFL